MTDRPAPRPPRVDPRALERAALHHLQRYVASAEQLRRVLRRRLDRAVRRAAPDDAPIDVAQVRADIEAVVQAMAETGAVDDRLLAFGLAAELLRKGTSRPLIAQKLRARGLASPLANEAITAAFEATREQGIDPDLAAATSYARRRRLGPFQTDGERRRARRDKDLQALARRGFSYTIARRVVDAETEDDLPAALL